MTTTQPHLRHDALRRIYAKTKDVPPFRRARRRVVKALRRNRRARRLAHQIFAVRGTRTSLTLAPADLAAGNLLGGVGTETLPVVLVLLIERPLDDVASVVQEVAELQVLTASFRPLFVIDTQAFAAVRRFGYPVELVISRADWNDARAEWNDAAGSWDTYLRQRLASIVKRYRTSGAVRATSGTLDPIDRALLSGGL